MEFPNKLYHYCDNENLIIHPQTRILSYERKPCGLWVSVEDDPKDQDWLSWSIAEEYALERLIYRYKVTIKDPARILWLRNDKEIKDFSLLYDDGEYLNLADPDVSAIRWKEVAKLYGGIIIAPYSWECRNWDSTSWYYGWDCASGCIWDTNLIEIERDLEYKFTITT